MPIQQDIERLAYDLWEREGKPEGNDLAYYYRAEQELAPKPKRTTAGKSTTKTTASKPRTTRKAA